MKTNEEAKLPAAREDELIVQEMGEEVLVYDQRQRRAHCLNRTAALVWRELDGRQTAAEVAARLSREVGATVAPEVVELAVEELRRGGLLSGGGGGRGGGVSRREMMRRVGLGAAVGLPVVASVLAPKAAEAASCLPGGSACTTSAQCCSGICNASTCA